MTISRMAPPERWHAYKVNRQTRRGNPRPDQHVDPFSECPACDKARDVCRNKLRFADWAEAREWVDEYNESHRYVDPVVRYPCRWCQGYHMNTARQVGELRRAMRARRKWLIAQGVAV